jgi:RNA polymerase sigma-70 factor (ECF subfamily)
MGNADESNDVIQEAFVKIYKNLDKYSFKGSFEGWMKRIVVNCCLEYMAKHKKVKFESETVLLNTSSSNWELPISDMSVQEIVEMVNKLPIGYRTVFNLNVIEGYSHKEIGEQLGISESASRSQLTKAKAKLKELLKEIEIYNSAVGA